MEKLWNAVKGCVAIVMFLLVLGIGIEANAAPGPVSDLKQTDSGTSSVTITFRALLDNDVSYEVQVSDSPTGVFKRWRDCASGECYLYGLPNAGSSYYVRVVPYYEENFQKEYGTPSQALEVVTEPNAKPANLKHVTSTEKSISLAWSAVSGAKCYQVLYSGYGSRDDLELFTASTTAVLDKLMKDTKYNIKVYPVRKSASGFCAIGSSYESLYSVLAVPGKAEKPDCSSYWANIGDIRVDAVSSKPADGYKWEVWTAYQKKDKKLRTIEKGKDVEFISHKEFRKFHFFKVRVAAYCTNSDGKALQGKWSDWEYFCPQPEINRLKASKAGITVKWSTIKGADKYEVYVSNKKKSGYKKCFTTKKTSATVKKFGKTSFKNGKKYYFYVEAYHKDGKKLYSGLAGNATSRWEIKYKK